MTFSRLVRDLGALKKIMSTPRMQKDLTAVFDQAGLSSVAPEVIQILSAADAAVLKEMNFEIGSTMEWMALRTKGKPDILRSLRWGGQKPFAASEFFIDDGNRGYTFMLPKACGNLLLARTGPSPKAEAAEAARKAEEAREAEEARRAEEARLAEERRKDKIDVFFEGDGGKERRERERTLSDGLVHETGVCAPLVGFKAGADNIENNYQVWGGLRIVLR